MNNTYCETLEENFEQALNLCENEYTHKELIDFLTDGNIVEKQMSALKLENIMSDTEAQILLSNLTGIDGKIREAVSLKLKEFMSNPDYLGYFNKTEYIPIYINAIIDINSNICRNVISAISHLKINSDFCKIFGDKLLDLCEELTSTVEQFDYQEGKYKINKEVFKLYWGLETIYDFYDKLDFDRTKALLLKTKDIEEYTIREKTAKILTKEFIDKELLEVKQQLKNDNNYFVRRF